MIILGNYREVYLKVKNLIKNNDSLLNIDKKKTLQNCYTSAKIDNDFVLAEEIKKEIESL